MSVNAFTGGFKPSKGLGQNFLIDPRISRKILDHSGIDGADVIEIGPGYGALTYELAERAARLVCVEIDEYLYSTLRSTLELRGALNATLIHGDGLTVDYNGLITTHFGAGTSPVVCANLPYSTGVALLTTLLNAKRFNRITVMLQQEVAARICAVPGTKDYGSFSVFVGYYMEPSILFTVPPTVFSPRPKVTSAVVQLIKRETRDATDEQALFELTRAAFAQRRKTLVNSVASVTSISKDRLASALAELGLPIDIRGERLSVDDYVELNDILCSSQ